MKSLGKILGLFFLGLLLIIVALGFALTHLFDPNDYKDEIRDLAREKANLELTLNGDIGWSLFPWLGLELTDATLASADTPDKPFADLRLLGLSVRVLPLLRKEVQMSDIRVDGLNLNLEIDDKGHSNWENVGHPRKTASATDAPDSADKTAEAAPQAPSKPSDPIKLDIDSLIVNSARVDYHNAQKGQQFSAESIQLTTGAIHEGASVPVKLSAFFGINKPVMRARTELQGDLRFDRVLKRYELENAKVSGEASGEPLNGQTLTYALQGQLSVDMAANIAQWSSLKLSANQMRAIGELKVTDLRDKPKLSGGFSVAEVNLRQFLKGIGQEIPAMADENTLNKFELVTRLSGSPSSIKFNEMTLKLDDSTFNGELAVDDFSRQALRVKLKGDKLDLDRYLPPKSKEASARDAEVKQSVAKAGKAGTSELPNAPTQQAWSSAQVLPIDRLRKLDMQVALNLDQLTADKQNFSNVDLQAKSAGGLLTLDNASGSLGSGSFVAKARVDVRPATPVLSLQSTLKRLPVEPFLTTAENKAPVRGLLDLQANLTTSGNSQKAWVEALNGTSSFALENGVLVGANLEQQICQGIATLNRKQLTREINGTDTPFKTLNGNLTFRNGVASNPDLKVEVPGLNVTGDGDLDLRVLGLDYRIGVTLLGDTRAMPDPACQVNERYVGLEWPIRCRGPLELGAKACRLDKDGLGKVAAKLAGDKLTEKLEEKLGDKVSPELKDALKGLFKR
ncbi:AsmA family protein [Pseudomonas segetis]|uniref:AsmA protein n=1 Tax=Pseudomonas segetis TaxID=298908 RepID=A0A239DU62_9PSED|nr:AsmA family protein [Pseudomonas segetis]SNS35779.1 AsmA protein [Pseudomonas segetis]